MRDSGAIPPLVLLLRSEHKTVRSTRRAYALCARPDSHAGLLQVRARAVGALHNISSDVPSIRLIREAVRAPESGAAGRCARPHHSAGRHGATG